MAGNLESILGGAWYINKEPQPPETQLRVQMGDNEWCKKRPPMVKVGTIIRFDDVIKIINENSKDERLTTKGDILDELNLEDTKENRKLLTKVTDELKKQGIIWTSYGLNEGEPGYRGRGYMMVDTRFSEKGKDGN